MSPRVNHRDLAKRQRRALKRDGFTEHDIEVFAQIFCTTDTTAEPAGLGCAADTTAAEAGTNQRSSR